MKIKFVRFGNLGSYIQKDYVSEPEGYHSPPAKKGFYAFPQGYFFDFCFLLGATNNPNNKSNKSAWLKDKDGNILEYDEYPDNLFEVRDRPEYSIFLPKEPLKFLKQKKVPKKRTFVVKIIRPEFCFCFKNLGLKEKFYSQCHLDELDNILDDIKINGKCSDSNRYELRNMDQTERQKILDSHDGPFGKLSEEGKERLNRLFELGIIDHDEIEKISLDCHEHSFYRIGYYKKPKIFEYEGDIWHHLEKYTPNNFPIIKKKGDWIKTDYQTYCRIFENMLHQIKKEKFEEIFKDKKYYNYSRERTSQLITIALKKSLLKSGSNVGTDFLEVFIEKI